VFVAAPHDKKRSNCPATCLSPLASEVHTQGGRVLGFRRVQGMPELQVACQRVKDFDGQGLPGRASVTLNNGMGCVSAPAAMTKPKLAVWSQLIAAALSLSS
jgi:hypothetical protein